MNANQANATVGRGRGAGRLRRDRGTQQGLLPWKAHLGLLPRPEKGKPYSLSAECKQDLKLHKPWAGLGPLLQAARGALWDTEGPRSVGTEEKGESRS